MAERAEVKVFAKRKRYKKLFKHAISPKSLAPVIDAFRKSCIHTSYTLLLDFKNLIRQNHTKAVHEYKTGG
jgi:hypothetical protein